MLVPQAAEVEDEEEEDEDRTLCLLAVSRVLWTEPRVREVMAPAPAESLDVTALADRIGGVVNKGAEGGGDALFRPFSTALDVISVCLSTSSLALRTDSTSGFLS